MKVIKIKLTDGFVIKLEGEMMLGYEAKDFHDAIQAGLETGNKKIVVDLGEIKFISSWGVGILIHGYTTVRNAGGSFRLAVVPNNVIEVLKVTKLSEIFKQYITVDEALKD